MAKYAIFVNIYIYYEFWLLEENKKDTLIQGMNIKGTCKTYHQ